MTNKSNAIRDRAWEARNRIKIDYSRNNLLTVFGKETLDRSYKLEGEDYQDVFARVAGYYADDDAHAQRLYDYISQLWFMPATPILSNGGTTRGLPISCFLGSVSDSMNGILDNLVENAWLASKGGGIGVYWGDVRSIGEKVGHNGETTGIVPFMKVQDSMTLAISQGSLRRGSAAAYLPVWHPEIEEFLDIRRPTGGDPNRKALNLHHGIVVDDAFMEAVEKGAMYGLRSPKTNEVMREVSARDLWAKILTTRVETGEPYILFIDTVNSAIPAHHKELGLEVKQSNLCVAPETKVLTRRGQLPIRDIAGEKIEVWNGFEFSEVEIVKTGESQKLVKVRFDNGATLDCTPYHKFYTQNTYHGKPVEVRASDLKPGDKLMKMNLPVIEMEDVNEVPCSVSAVPTFATLSSRLDWFRDLLSSNGATVRDDEQGPSLQIASANKEFLRDVRLMLQTMGTCSSVVLSDGGDMSEPQRQELWKLLIPSEGIETLTQLGLWAPHLEITPHSSQHQMEQVATVVEVADEGRVDDTYCFVEPKLHLGVFNGVLTGQCAEITLPTGIDHLGMNRTAVCCLSSLNLEKINEWADCAEQMIEDVLRMLDNVLEDFIEHAHAEMHRAVYSAIRERSVGLGVMGFHALLQSRGVAMDGEEAREINLNLFSMIKRHADAANVKLAEERGACPDAEERGYKVRFSNMLAHAPTASISVICGTTSPGCEPFNTNAFTQKTLSGSFMVKNRYLEALLQTFGKNTPEVWSDIIAHGGSVQHLDWMTDEARKVFQTGAEIDQMALIEMAADRQPYICQSQSLNLFLASDVHKRDLHKIHFRAWKAGVKSLYYIRSRSVQRAEAVAKSVMQKSEMIAPEPEECLACQ